jgi:hypothetical protein
VKAGTGCHSILEHGTRRLKAYVPDFLIASANANSSLLQPMQLSDDEVPDLQTTSIDETVSPMITNNSTIHLHNAVARDGMTHT